MTDEERFAAIGRAVVEHLHPDNPRAARQATPELVVDHLRRLDGERRSLENCAALRVGRHLLALDEVLAQARAPK